MRIRKKLEGVLDVKRKECMNLRQAKPIRNDADREVLYIIDTTTPTFTFPP